MLCLRGEARLGPGWGAPSTAPHDGVNMPPEDMLKALKLLQSVMTEEDFSKYEKMVMPPPPKKEERVKVREEELWRQCQKEEHLRKSRYRCISSKLKSMSTIWSSRK